MLLLHIKCWDRRGCDGDSVVVDRARHDGRLIENDIISSTTAILDSSALGLKPELALVTSAEYSQLSKETTVLGK